MTCSHGSYTCFSSVIALSDPLTFFFVNHTPTTEISTLSYTTLFRSPRSTPLPAAALHRRHREHRPRRQRASRAAAEAVGAPRSEEHTSELQSRQYLVCRLLLEKKKNKNRNTTIQTTHTTR